MAVTGRVNLDADPLYADTPLEVAMLSLFARPLCRVDRTGAVVADLAELGTSGARSVVVTLRPGAGREGAPIDATYLAGVLRRVQQEPTPYRGLLLPLKALPEASDKTQLELPLAFPFPDFARSLCHPALAMALEAGGKARARSGVGPFLPTLLANPLFPEGRPYADAIALVPTDVRGAERQLSQRRVQVALGTGSGEVPLPFATYLAFNPQRVGAGVRAAVESTVDRRDLTRFFVHPPAAPLPSLVPLTSLDVATDAGHLLEKFETMVNTPLQGRKVTLLYDASQEDQRAVAERLQVKLHAAGYQVALSGLARAELRAKWAAGDYDLMLASVFLPASAPAALSVVLELSRAPREKNLERLAQLGAIADDRAREKAAQELAWSLREQLDLVPLYAQGLAVSAAPNVQHLTFDFEGVPLLDGVFLGQD